MSKIYLGFEMQIAGTRNGKQKGSCLVAETCWSM